MQPLIGTALLAFMAGLMQQISHQKELPLEEFQYVSLLTSAAVVLCLLLPMLLAKKALHVERLYALAIPLSAAGFLLLPLIWNGAGGIVNSFVQLGSMVADIVLLCLLAAVARNIRLFPTALFALALACTDGAQLAGTLIGFLNAESLQREHLVLTAVALVAAYLIFMVAFFLFKDKSFKKGAAELGMATEQGAGMLGEQERQGVGERELAAGVPQRDDLLLQRCKDIAQQNLFTTREGEIFLLLAQGYTIVVVSEKLFVSENTVKSHVKSIYQKLNIHSRSALIKLAHEGQGTEQDAG